MFTDRLWGRLLPRSWRRAGRWVRRGAPMPAPQTVKWAVLHRYGRATDTWVETGTYRGWTTEFLAAAAAHVYSIEPAPELAQAARQRFAGSDRVTIIESLSEECLDGVLAGIEGPVSLWLDGHYSGGVTHRGPLHSPIVVELGIVARHLERWPVATVLVDDVRLFEGGSSGYPPRSWLVHWADEHGLAWAIEHDIFVAIKR